MANRARENRIRQLVASLTQKEKLQLLCGGALWTTAALPEAGLPALRAARLFCASAQIEQQEEGSLWPAAAAAVRFPAPSALACSFDEELVEEVAEAVGEECRAAGVNLLLGPSAALKKDPLCGDNFDRFSSSPLLCGSLAAAFVRGLAKKGVGACVTGFGSGAPLCSAPGSDTAVEEQQLQQQDLGAFRALLSRCEPAAIRCDANRINGQEIACREDLITQLREQMGFSGAVLAPFGGGSDPAAALAAGASLQLPGSEAVFSRLEAALQEGRLTQQQLDDGALQAARLLQSWAGSAPAAPCNREKHRALARRAAKQCMVLLKNENNLLPFTGREPIAVIGSFAKQPHFGALGYAAAQPYRESSLLSGLQLAGQPGIFAEGYNPDGSTNGPLVAEAKRVLMQAGRGILVLGLPAGEESVFANRADGRLPDGMLKLADCLAATGCPLAVVLVVGAPVELPFADRVDALLLAGLCGEAGGEAAAELLLGRANPSGKLAEDWPVLVRAGQPAGEIRFRFGHGLSYVPAAASEISMDKRSIIGARQKLTVSCRMESGGDQALSATLQLYAAAAAQPPELVGFCKVRLLPGEVKNVQLDFSGQALLQYAAGDGRGRLMPGSYRVWLAEGRGGEFSPVAEFPLQVLARESAAVRSAPPKREEGSEPPVGFGPHSTAQQLAGTLAGRALFEMVSAFAEEAGCPCPEKLKSWLLQLPVRMLPAATRGAISEKKISGTLMLLNKRLIRGIINVFGK